MPFGTSEKDVQNYLAEKQAYEQKALDQNLSVEELGAQELAAYEASPRSRVRQRKRNSETYCYLR